MSDLSVHSLLISQADASSSQLPDWQRLAAVEIQETISDPGFPCVFSRNACRKGLIKFAFVDDDSSASIDHLANALQQYVEMSRNWDSRLDSAYPLVVVFSHEAISNQGNLAAHHAFAWHVLQQLHALDPDPWPSAVPTSPTHPEWSMCFAGMQLFVNMSSPHHIARRSRDLGRHLVMVINPRERFDVFAGNTPSGRNTRSKIRERIERYDGMPHAPQLGWFGTGSLEWTQYGLPDSNVTVPAQCPFHQLSSTARSNHNEEIGSLV